jgi:ubiquinone/menaquinone biosynthesis C-methylase UbiE
MSKAHYWGRGVRDWVELQEPLHRPLYDAMLDALALQSGGALLDAGCGSGVVCVLAAERGLSVTGLDASPRSIEVARRRCPDGQFYVADLGERFPFESDIFDGVVFCNSLQYVSHPEHALREAVRVLRPAGRVAIAVFDAPRKYQGHEPIAAVMSLLPPAPSGSPEPFALSTDAALEALVRDAHMEFEGIQRVNTPWHYRNLEMALRAFISAGPAQQAIEIVGEEKLRAVLEDAIIPHVQADGTYRFDNMFKFVVAGKRAAD